MHVHQWQAARLTPSPPPPPAPQVVLLVASEEGIFYRYNIEELRNPAGPKCALVGEWTLLGSALAS
jgi:hypothetical protein